MRNWEKILEDNKNLTQLEMAKKCGVSKQRIYQLCKRYSISLKRAGRNWEKIFEENKNLPAKEIGRKYKIPYSSISMACRKHNITLPKSPRKDLTAPKETEEIIKLYKKGIITVQKIKEKVGKTITTIYRILKRNKIKLREGK